jgi:hypothetical protein
MEFLGYSEDGTKAKHIHLKQPAITQVHGNQRMIKPLDAELDYNCETFMVHNGPGVFMFDVREDGELGKHYKNATSRIHLPTAGAKVRVVN